MLCPLFLPRNRTLLRFTDPTMKYFPVLLLLFYLSACAGLDPTADRLKKLDRFLAAQEFDQALSLIADTPRLESNTIALEKEWEIIVGQLHLFEKSTISKALRQEQDNDWPGAKATYEKALKTAATSQDLQQSQRAMLHRFQRKMQALENEELIVNGEWLYRKLPLLKEQHGNDPDNQLIKWKYQHTRDEAKETGVKLLQLGEEMLAEKNIEMARRSIPLAAVLFVGQESKNAVDRLNTILRGREERSRKNQERSRRNQAKIVEAKGKKQVDAFNNAMAHGKLSLARTVLAELTSISTRPVQTELMQERLDKEIADYVQEETAIGTAFYRVGEYELAITVWQNIIELVPDNEIVTGKLDRAKRIVEKLESLRNRQE